MRLDRLFGSLLDSTRDSSAARNRIIFWISILLAALFLYLALRDLEWSTFFSTLRNAQVTYLPLFLVWISLSYVIRAYRWRILLNGERPVTVKAVFLANMAGYLGNTILPARTGELVRAAYIAKQESVPMSFALATGLTERLLDVIALVILGSLSLSVTGVLSSTLEAGLYIMGLIGFAGLMVILLLPRLANVVEKLLDRLPLLQTVQKKKIHAVVQSFLIGLTSLANTKRAISFTMLTGVIWLADAAGIGFLSYLLSLSLTLPQSFVLLAALGLSSAIPSTPGYVGVYQFAAILALKPFGFSSADSVALVLSTQILNMVVIGLWGMIAAGRFNRFSRALL